MSKEVLQITISKRKAPKTKLGRFLYNKIWFPFWYIWRNKVLALFYGAIADFIYWLAPKHIQEQWDKEFEEIDMIITSDDWENEE